jgi:hypothetical protein
MKPEDRRPRFDILNVNAGKCSHVPEATRLELQFLNDRLARVILIMPDPKSYLDTLSHQTGWSRAADGSLLRAPGTRVWSAVNWKNETYVTWEDTCLSAEERSWIETFASLRAACGMTTG